MTLPMMQPPHEDIQDGVLAELIMDIEEEDTAEPGHCFRNRFLHRFLDTYNAKMGNFGNYIKSTQQTLTERVNNIEGSLDCMMLNSPTSITSTIKRLKMQIKKYRKWIQKYHTLTPF